MIVDSKWVDKYKTYLQRRSIDLKKRDLNRPIDNSHILRKARMSILKESEYYKLSEDVYRFVEGIYGGGPEIRESELDSFVNEFNVPPEPIDVSRP